MCGGGWLKEKRQASGGCWEKAQFVLKGSHNLNFRFTVKGMATFDGLLLFLSPFFIFLMPRHTIKVKEI